MKNRLFMSIVIAIVANALMLGSAALLTRARSLPEKAEEITNVDLTEYDADEDPEEETEAPPPPPQEEPPPQDFQPDLFQPDLSSLSDGPSVGGVAINVGKAGGLDKDSFVFESFELDQAPKPRSKSQPVYPKRALQQGIEGAVQIRLLVRDDGTVGDIQILDADPAGMGFEEAVDKGVRKWKFEPGKIDGRGVTAWVVTTVRFRLDG